MNFDLTKTKVILLFSVIGLILYANTFNNQMFWDDDDIILENHYVQNFDFPKFFSENQIAGSGLVSNYWRPMLLTVFGIEWKLWGPSPFGYHLVNTVFHVVSAILLFYILQKLFKKKLLAFLTALVFLAHPLQTEAVTYISGLADPLSTFFIFLGILFYFKFRDFKSIYTSIYKNKYYWAALGCYVLALLSKDTAVVMPGLLLLTDFFYVSGTFKEKVIKTIKYIWPFFVLAGTYMLLRATALNFHNTFNVYGEDNLFTQSLWIRILTFFKAISIYFQLLFWPNNLHMERSFEIPLNITSLDVIVGAQITLLMLVAGFYNINKRPIISFGIFWFFIRLFPNSNLLVPNSGLMYEHWMYVPMIGIFLIVVWLLLESAKKLDISSQYDFQKIFAGIFIIYLIPLSIKTIQRNNDWQDPITFYEQTRSYSPHSYRVTNNLAMSYANASQFDKAIATYQDAIKLDSKNAVAYHNLANSYRDTGQKNLAIENYEKALSLDSDFLYSYNALAQLYLNEKQYDEAIAVLERLKAITTDPNINEIIDQIKKLPR